MPRLLPAILLTGLLAALAPMVASAGDLTLRDLVELHHAGLGDEVLIAVIEADGGAFELSVDDIRYLKTEGLGERVIVALIRTSRRPAPMPTPTGNTEVDGEEGWLEEPQPSSSGPRAAPEAAPTYVDVYQHVTTFVPVVVERSERRDRGDRTDGDRRRRTDSPPAKPPATWVTRREDGRNVVPSASPDTPDKPDTSGRADSSARDASERRVPAATWVTPRPR